MENVRDVLRVVGLSSPANHDVSIFQWLHRPFSTQEMSNQDPLERKAENQTLFSCGVVERRDVLLESGSHCVRVDGKDESACRGLPLPGSSGSVVEDRKVEGRDCDIAHEPRVVLVPESGAGNGGCRECVSDRRKLATRAKPENALGSLVSFPLRRQMISPVVDEME